MTRITHYMENTKNHQWLIIRWKAVNQKDEPSKVFSSFTHEKLQFVKSCEILTLIKLIIMIIIVLIPHLISTVK